MGRIASERECEGENNECDVICMAVILPRVIMRSKSVPTDANAI